MQQCTSAPEFAVRRSAAARRVVSVAYRIFTRGAVGDDETAMEPNSSAVGRTDRDHAKNQEAQTRWRERVDDRRASGVPVTALGDGQPDRADAGELAHTEGVGVAAGVVPGA
jgi:hypothetical protein